MHADNIADAQALNLTDCEKKEIAENIARRVFYDVLQENYGIEFADIVSAEVLGGKQE